MDEIEKAVFVENPRGYLKALDRNKKRTHFYILWIIVILFKKYYKDKLTEDGEVSGDAAVAALTDIDTKINAYRLIEVSLAQKVR